LTPPSSASSSSLLYGPHWVLVAFVVILACRVLGCNADLARDLAGQPSTSCHRVADV
jgi:hypothetical protein